MSNFNQTNKPKMQSGGFLINHKQVEQEHKQDVVM